ncbi:UTRA domain-containing protein [Pseudomonas sp. JDS28PS106]|uniref:UTRA domain-containing protein n=1 Tax=Pseudomonas sp. JDS28PS106 TaxID=2497235 RepID=UPI002FD6AE27
MRHEMPRAVSVICQALREQIGRGLLRPGSRLPAERRLSELFATTRITLREALAQLEAQGLIYREERRGWFISPPPLVYDLMSRGEFDARVRAQGREAQTRLISARLQPAPADMCERLQLPALSSVIQICRANSIDGQSVLYVEHYLKPAFFPDILESDLTCSLGGLYADRYRLEGEAHVEIRPVALRGEACAALKASAGSPALCISRITFDRHGHPVACDMEYWRHHAIRVCAVIAPDAR